MKITVALGPYLSPPPGRGGAIEHRWAATAAEWARTGHDVTVVCRALDDPALVFPLDCGVRYVPVRGYRRTGSIGGDIVMDLVYSNRVRREMHDTDVVVMNTFWLPILEAPFRRSRRWMTIYNMARQPKRQFALYRHVDRILATSQAVADALRVRVPALAERTRVVPNPIDTSVFRALPGKEKTLHEPVVLFTGRLHPEKGLDLLVRACAKLALEVPNLVLRLVGESSRERGGGGDEFIERLRREAGERLRLDISEPIYDRAKLADVLRSCSVYCYPSIAEKGESFGVAPLEAMAVGAAVVLSSLECFSEYARDGENVIMFDHRTTEAVERLGDALGRLLASPAEAQRLGQAAARDAAQFGYAAIASRYIDVFKEGLMERRSLGL